MQEEHWDIEVDSAIREWLAQNRSNLAAEITKLAGPRDLDVQVLPAAGDTGRKEIAAVLLATAAVIKALNPIILAMIKVRFPNAAIREEKGGRRSKLKIRSDK